MGAEPRLHLHAEPRADGDRLSHPSDRPFENGEEPAPADAPANVCFVKGGDRRRNMLEPLRAIEKDVREGIGDRGVVVKPNFMSTTRQLAATHAEAVMGILDFLKPFYRKTVLLAELDADEHKEFWLLDRERRRGRCVRKFQLADSIEGQLRWKSDDFQWISLEGDAPS